jgi:ribosomal protein L24E
MALLAGMVVLASRPASAQAAPTPPISPGYWLMASDGGVYQFGTTNFGSMRGHTLNQPIVGSAALEDGLGYWLVAADGGVFAFGAAGFYGSTGGVHLNQPIVGMAPTPDGHGYWLVARDGGIFTFGDAGFYGSTGNVHLNQPIVGMAATPNGQGYWLVAADGGIFTFGDAGFYGSTGGIHINQPVVGMAATSEGKGYWLVARDGGIFTFGDAGFYGSTGGIHINQPVVGMAATSEGKGYWLVASDGGIFTFGDAPFLGSTGGDPGPAPIIGMAAAHGYPFPPGATGYDISQFQCPGFPFFGSIPPAPQGVAVVQVSGGAIDASPNPCYAAEVSWAGSNDSAYIFMDGLPSPAPPVSDSGPAGTCNGNVSCESYNFGWYWARNWVAYSRNLGVDPWLWWLDVETDGAWNGGPAGQASNASVISGAYAGLQASGVVPGIYSTAYQWGKVAGSLAFPNVPLWIPGAGNISGGDFSAQNFCAGTIPAPYGTLYEPFADGIVTLVQYGLVGNGYNGPSSKYDRDYACL